jgi:predicted small secreted protein
MKTPLFALLAVASLGLNACRTTHAVAHDTKHVAKKTGHAVGHATEKVGNSISHAGEKLEKKTDE